MGGYPRACLSALAGLLVGRLTYSVRTMLQRVTRRTLSLVMAVSALVSWDQNSMLGFPDGAKFRADRVLGPILLVNAAVSAMLAFRFWATAGNRRFGGGEWLSVAVALISVIACLVAEPFIRECFPPEY